MSQGVVEDQAYKVVLHGEKDEEEVVVDEALVEEESEPAREKGAENDGGDVDGTSPVAAKVPVPTVEAAPAINILNGPWALYVFGGSDAWGLGAELRSLLLGLAESSAERER